MGSKDSTSGLLFCGVQLSPEQVRSLQICVTYAIASITISMMYKAILSSWNFDATALLLTAQVVIGLVFCWVGRAYFPPATQSMLQFADVNVDTLIASIPLGLLFVVNIVVGWYGLKLVDVPTFLAIRRTTTVFTMAGEFFMLGIVPSSMVRLGVVVIVIGTIIAGWESLSSSLSGYLFTLANNILTAIQLNFARRFKDQTGVQGFGLVLYNGLTALPICLMLVLFQGEVAYVAAYPHLTNPAFLVSVIGASALGCFMTYIVLLCATVNSPLVTSVTGNVKDIASTVIGAVLFNDFVPTVLKVGGILLSFCGSGIFSYAKLTESSAAGRASTSAGATASAASVGTAAGTGIADGSVTHGAGYSGLSTPGGGALYDAHTADLDEDDYDDEDADRAVFAANGKSRYADGESASATVVDKPNSRKYHGQGGAV